MTAESRKCVQCGKDMTAAAKVGECLVGEEWACSMDCALHYGRDHCPEMTMVRLVEEVHHDGSGTYVAVAATSRRKGGSE